MRQHITPEQFRSLSTRRRSAWFDWAVRKGYAKSKNVERPSRFSPTVDTVQVSEMHLPNIGQCIQFLDEQGGSLNLYKWHEGWTVTWKNGHGIDPMFHSELIDALWEVVKAVLESEEKECEECKDCKGLGVIYPMGVDTTCGSCQGTGSWKEEDA